MAFGKKSPQKRKSSISRVLSTAAPQRLCPAPSRALTTLNGCLHFKSTSLAWPQVCCSHHQGQCQEWDMGSGGSGRASPQTTLVTLVEKISTCWCQAFPTTQLLTIYPLCSVSHLPGLFSLELITLWNVLMYLFVHLFVICFSHSHHPTPTRISTSCWRRLNCLLISSCETKQDSMGLLGTEAPQCLPFLVGNRLQSPWPSLTSKGQIWVVTNQGREWIQERKGKD